MVVTGELIPEKRLDKNGVLTTKHVRATPKGNPSTQSLPNVDDTAARALKVFDSIRNQRGTIAASFVNEIQRELESGKSSQAVIERLVLTLNPKTLMRLELFKRTVLNGITDNISCGIRERSFSRLNNFAVLRNDCGNVTDSEASWFIGGLNADRKRSDWLDYGDATEDDLAVPRAVLKAVTALDENFVTTDSFTKFPTKSISSALLVELIESRPQYVDRIVAIVNERKPVLDEAGINGIAQLLDSGTHDAMMNGTL
jgi:hypothetical protein